MDTCTDDNIFAIAVFLLPRDLYNIALVCKHFGQKHNATSQKMPTKRRQRRQGSWPWSMMEEASRRRVSAAKNSKHNPWRDSQLISIRGKESWMAVHQRLYSLQCSLVFSRIIGSAINHVDGDITHIRGRKKETVGFSVAIGQKVMKAGRHYAEFTVTNGGKIYLGIIRPIHDWPKKKIKHADFWAHCRRQIDSGYQGSVHQHYHYDERNTLEKGDVIRLLLDLTRGTLTVYKNGESLGTEVRSGLAGYYCWSVTMNNHGSNRPSVRIGYALNKKEA